MTRRTGIFLFCVYLVTATPFNQLLKVPVLTLHFQEHLAYSEELSFYEFLSMHYVGDDQRDDDQQRDMQLPFQSTDHCSFAVSTVPVATLSIPVPRGYSGTVLSVYESDRFRSSFSAFVWQPPEC